MPSRHVTVGVRAKRPSCFSRRQRSVRPSHAALARRLPMPAGPMSYGQDNDAGPDQTRLRSTRPVGPNAADPNALTATLMVINSATGQAIVAQQNGPGQAAALHGLNAGGMAVIGDSETGRGVVGSSDVGDGVFGSSVRRNGVQGESQTRVASGVYGENLSGGGFGVAGRSNVPPPTTFPFVSPYGAAVYGDNNAGGAAGVFNGSVRINGGLIKSGGGFLIDSPLDPANRYLHHSFVESPDMMNIYN